MKNYVRNAAALLGLAVLTACGTPQERCINAATRDMRVVDQLIAETKGNLQRGFAFTEQTTYRTEFQDCTPYPTAAHPSPAPRLCPVEVAQTNTRPVAIDLAAERAKLASLVAKRQEQGIAAQPAIAQCRALHPQ